ncbi:MAG: serine hydrolase domain-containing protein [Sphingorhabdus sp.]
MDEPQFSRRAILSAGGMAAVVGSSGFAATTAAAKNVDIDTALRPVLQVFDTDDQSGLALLVTDGGEIVFQKGYGVSDLDSGARWTIDTPHMIASVSKHMAAALAYRMEQAGKVSTKAPLGAVLKDLPPFLAKQTLDDCFYHRTGMRDDEIRLLLAGYDSGSAVDLDGMHYLHIAQQEPAYVPGSAHVYENSAWRLATRYLEVASGEDQDALFQRYLFQPAGMAATFMAKSQARPHKGRSRFYRVEENGEVFQRFWVMESAGDGGLLSTARDLFKWTRFLQKEAGLRTWLSNPQKLPHSGGFYARGLEIAAHHDHGLLRHTGWGGTGFFYAPTTGRAVIFTGNRNYKSATLGLRIYDALWPSKTGVAVGYMAFEAASPQALGAFVEPGHGLEIRLDRAADIIRCTINSSEAFCRFGKGSWIADSGDIDLALRQIKNRWEIAWDAKGFRTLLPIISGTQALPEGNHYCTELQASMHCRADGTLHFAGGFHPDNRYKVENIGQGIWSNRQGLTLKQQADGTIMVNSGTCWGLQYRPLNMV